MKIQFLNANTVNSMFLAVFNIRILKANKNIIRFLFARSFKPNLPYFFYFCRLFPIDFFCCTVGALDRFQVIAVVQHTIDFRVACRKISFIIITLIFDTKPSTESPPIACRIFRIPFYKVSKCILGSVKIKCAKKHVCIVQKC